MENSVEISGLSRSAVAKSLVLPESAYGEGDLVAIFSMSSASRRSRDSFTDTSHEAKVSDFHAILAVRWAGAELVDAT